MSLDYRYEFSCVDVFVDEYSKVGAYCDSTDDSNPDVDYE